MEVAEMNDNPSDQKVKIDQESNILKNNPWIENLFEGVYTVDVDRKILYWNQGAMTITGYNSDEIIRRSCFDNILNHVNEDGVGLCFDGCPLKATIEDGVEREAAVYLRHKSGHRVPVKVRTIPLRDREQTIIGALELFTENKDEVSIRNSLENYKRQSNEDFLTKASNRRYFLAMIESKIREFKIMGTPFGIAFLDIDNFKHVNDSFGHEVGDKVLKILTETIQSNLRKNDLLGRWGGEEFVILFSDVDSDGLMIASEKARKLVAASSLKLSDQYLNITISIGATLFIENDDCDSIVTRADQLMYLSKRSGKNKVTIG
ncbi:MAG: sensor domain-containing diguanylate cyclase [Firmicutes bacterium HGW-Firmicutes-10]|nr:MAG: sensor domain-containing diguanylate cyclase [Firmicutes bacterium HGW-Firmicutes-10]